MTRPKTKQSPPPTTSSSPEGYCQSCGRLLPRENKTDPTPRKYCSSTCRSHGKSPYLKGIRTALIEGYHRSLDDRPTGQVILCSEVEKNTFDPTSNKDKDEKVDNNQTSSLSPTEQREESRRAARRIVAFGFPSQGIAEEGREVEAIQNGKSVETSFAKGEWGIRWK
ncbi:hypothetical protein L486_06331 [Kwoniella mangroviensis CBS 10435]|uniref:Uncharacterized protein n=1 Tax=Kwoniella mangroviensis CBS 10435 TaxID=1331196 RepID=A0A1B9IL72_9TREE|nr:uncharacterized protein I203_07953 [Kwoniella mangroviensis CBS 8507]OCF56388.1 hypothetical protein L486_06331 [Kwoniella mangroviensis CBS 10435]OCF62973.1 hypothetical protein I203_07953 [Kwoniella mangroviensis CBS 8507]OCF79138.1 hypothetical protein I204_01084 [Kwoniella mangroviensis CBS 8886]